MKIVSGGQKFVGLCYNPSSNANSLNVFLLIVYVNYDLESMIKELSKKRNVSSSTEGVVTDDDVYILTTKKYTKSVLQ